MIPIWVPADSGDEVANRLRASCVSFLSKANDECILPFNSQHPCDMSALRVYKCLVDRPFKASLLASSALPQILLTRRTRISTSSRGTPGTRLFQPGRAATSGLCASTTSLYLCERRICFYPPKESPPTNPGRAARFPFWTASWKLSMAATRSPSPSSPPRPSFRVACTPTTASFTRTA